MEREWVENFKLRQMIMVVGPILIRLNDRDREEDL